MWEEEERQAIIIEWFALEGTLKITKSKARLLRAPSHLALNTYLLIYCSIHSFYVFLYVSFYNEIH